MREGRSVDASGRPIPWYTYPAVEYLSHLNLSGKKVFEFGSGNSSFWWAERVSHVMSVDNDEDWYRRIAGAAELMERLTVVLKKDEKSYVEALDSDGYDILIVDGRYRRACVDRIAQLYGGSNRGLMIVFDNSDWYPESIESLRRRLKWIQADFHGFGPINGYAWSTSIFINPDRGGELEYSSRIRPIAGRPYDAD